MPAWARRELDELRRLRNLLEIASRFAGPIADRFETRTLPSGETIQVRLPQRFEPR